MKCTNIVAITAMLVAAGCNQDGGPEPADTLPVVHEWQRGDRVILLPHSYIDDDLGWGPIVPESRGDANTWFIASGTEAVVIGPIGDGSLIDATVPSSSIRSLDGEPLPGDSQIVRLDARFLNRAD